MYLDMVAEELGVEPEQLPIGMVVNLYVGRGLHIEGYRRLLAFDSNSITFQYKKHRIEIEGNGLSFSSLSEDDAFVTGHITNIAVESV